MHIIPIMMLNVCVPRQKEAPVINETVLPLRDPSRCSAVEHIDTNEDTEIRSCIDFFCDPLYLKI